MQKKVVTFIGYRIAYFVTIDSTVYAESTLQLELYQVLKLQVRVQVQVPSTTALTITETSASF